MPARRDQREIGRHEVGVVVVIRRDVTADVVDRHERQSARIRERLREADSDEQRADQTGRVRDRDRVDIPESNARDLERFLGYPAYSVAVRAAGDLGHDSAVKPMSFDLRRYYVRAYPRNHRLPAAVRSGELADSGGGLITGAFK